MSEDRSRLLVELARKLLPEDLVEGPGDNPWDGLEGLHDGVSESLAQHLHGDASQLSEQDLGDLEAIILPERRPPLIVRAGSYDEPGPPWQHLDEDPARSAIEAVIPAVGRVELPRQPDYPYGGTAFLVAPDLMMTNWHVARHFVRGEGVRELLYTPGDSAVDFGQEAEQVSHLVEVVEPVLVHPFWDMALLRIAEPPPGIDPLVLGLTHPDDLVGSEVVVIGYPMIDPRSNIEVQNKVFGGLYGVKRVQPGIIGPSRQIRTSRHPVRAMTHDASTLGGNSGSVIFDVQHKRVVGLHFAGRYLDANFAVPAWSLGQDSRVVDAGLGFDGSAPGGDPHGRYWRDADEGPAAVAAVAGALASRPASTVASREAIASADGVEITVTVRIGGSGEPQVQVQGASAAAAAAAPVTEAVHPDPEYDDRQGYDADFLPGHHVPLPVLNAEQRADAAYNGWARGTPREDLFDYTHFTLAMSRSRRLAFFTAVNVHGGLLKPIPSGEWSSWMHDPRLPRRLQLGPEDYAENPLDRGHLVRRLDPVWGRSWAEARRANIDTYHYTNAAPQHLDLNRNTGSWLGVEDHIYGMARDTGSKLSVFTGPVFRTSDRVHRGVAIPEEYWKIVAMVHPDGRLVAAAFLLSQRDLITDLDEESLAGRWAEYQVTVAFIERITKLSFGPLRDADPLARPKDDESTFEWPEVRRITADSPPILEPAGEEGFETWGSLQVMRGLAAVYNLDGKSRTEKKWFKTHWKTVAALARMDLSDEAAEAHRATAFRMVDAAGPLLKAAIAASKARPTGKDSLTCNDGTVGHQHVRCLPRDGRYVIFSDHHITPSNHRQNFFFRTSNQSLYAKALEQYNDERFTLIENGDVEELLIWDPAVYTSFMEERMRWRDIGDDEYEKTLPKKLIEQRLAIRYRQLDDILTDPKLRPWRSAIKRFDNDGRLIRVAGNHDYNLQGRAFLNRFQQEFPNVEQVYDYVFIEGPDRHVDYAIMHGHQYDLTTNPASAPRFGETFSECVALWFQGGDRTWDFAADDSKPGDKDYVAEPDDWATGKAPFNNALVEDHHEDWAPDGEPAPKGPTDLPAGMDHLGHDVGRILLESIVRLEGIEELPLPVEEEGDFVDEEAPCLSKEWWEEKVFHHSVAWEFFAAKHGTVAIANEVLTGKRFFKYRHTNEQELARQLVLQFPDPKDRPTVIFGHTHEPRLSSTIPQEFIDRLRATERADDKLAADRLAALEGRRFPWYANSAAAGRFERLLWALEIDRGQIKLVSWALLGEGADRHVERREWEVTDKGVEALGDGHMPIPTGGVA